MSKEKGIIFSAPMVRAILEGRKSMTRRIVKFNDSGRVKLNGKQWHIEDPDAINGCPYGTAGSTLWVREKFDFFPCGMTSCEIFYWADGSSQKRIPPNDYNTYLYPNERVRPSIHMPRWASRITLEIVSVRVERVKEISYDDCSREGIPDCIMPPGTPCTVCSKPGDVCRIGFMGLWESIHGEGSWEQNPWVWVIEFGRIA